MFAKQLSDAMVVSVDCPGKCRSNCSSGFHRSEAAELRFFSLGWSAASANELNATPGYQPHAPVV
jgi:hypothetical protein